MLGGGGVIGRYNGFLNASAYLVMERIVVDVDVKTQYLSDGNF